MFSDMAISNSRQTNMHYVFPLMIQHNEKQILSFLLPLFISFLCAVNIQGKGCWGFSPHFPRD